MTKIVVAGLRDVVEISAFEFGCVVAHLDGVEFLAPGPKPNLAIMRQITPIAWVRSAKSSDHTEQARSRWTHFQIVGEVGEKKPVGSDPALRRTVPKIWMRGGNVNNVLPIREIDAALDPSTHLAYSLV